MSKKSFVFYLSLFFLTVACNKRADLYKVVGVKDGDTMVLLSPDNKQVTVRLAEVDCPEKSQAFGQAAKQFTSDLCFGKMARLIVNNTDRYGRTVGWVELEDGTNVNKQLVKSGFAWQYRAYSKSMELAMLEQQARQNHLGLWHESNPTPPWSFRKGERNHRFDNKAAKKKRSYKKRRSKPHDTVTF